MQFNSSIIWCISKLQTTKDSTNSKKRIRKKNKLQNIQVSLKVLPVSSTKQGKRWLIYLKTWGKIIEKRYCYTRYGIFAEFAKNKQLSHYVLPHVVVKDQKILITGTGKDSAVWWKFQILKIRKHKFSS